MNWSLLNHLEADKVADLLRDVRESYSNDPSFVPAMPENTALSIIHAVIWMHGARAGSTASGYAWLNLMNAIGIDPWGRHDATARIIADTWWAQEMMTMREMRSTGGSGGTSI